MDKTFFPEAGCPTPEKKVLHRFLFLHLLKCFTSVGSLPSLDGSCRFLSTGFPHSDIAGSKVAQHLPDAFRRYAASFIAHDISSHPPYALWDIHYPNIQVTVLLENAFADSIVNVHSTLRKQKHRRDTSDATAMPDALSVSRSVSQIGE